jgi:hypothetical protein
MKEAKGDVYKMIDNYCYDDESVIRNSGKIEVFSFMYGVAFGIVCSSCQALIQYVTNPDASVAFLGMWFLNLVLGATLGFLCMVIFRKYQSEKRKLLLEIPPKSDITRKR